jgi:pilus assembly protein CpaE
MAVKIVVKDPQLAMRLAEAIRLDGTLEIADPDAPAAALVILQLGANPESDLQQASAWTREGGEVFIVSDSADSQVLMLAMRAGVKEFLVNPIRPEEIKDALSRFSERQARAVQGPMARDGKLISVFGSKGGVGTTTVAVNLAVSLSQSGKKCEVALLDMNTLFGEIPLFLEVAPKFHWGEITKNIDRLDSSFLQNILSKHKSGVNILPSPAYLNGHVKPTPDIMTRLLALMKQMFDYVIIDAGQSTDDTSIRVLEVSDTLMLVTILSLPCLANTSKLIKSLVDLGYAPREKIKVILNRFIKKSEVSVEDAEAGIGKEIFWVVPNDYSTSMSSINSGKPLIQLAPKAPIAKSFIELAAQLNAGDTQKPRRKWGFFS